jgi:hypothetical protein
MRKFLNVKLRYSQPVIEPSTSTDRISTYPACIERIDECTRVVPG